ncbi:hypothetical protein [Bradyrhizobium macuxiense]|nr:hypothetical protein [Bradyrhizobium macuxiense]
MGGTKPRVRGPGQHQGGGAKPGQQQQDPGRQGEKPGQQGEKPGQQGR